MGDKTFNNRLKEILGTDSVRSFGMKCGISESVLRKYLKGTSDPGLENLKRIAKANHVTVGWLIGEEDRVKRENPILQHFPDPSMREITLWINEQNDGINYWEVVKAKLALEFPEFKDWLKKRREDDVASTHKKVAGNDK